MKPHRGTTVLILGILAVIPGCNCCFIPGILAWAYGSSDLAEMDRGTMDPAGRDITNIGRILGIIGTVVAILGALGIGMTHGLPMIHR